MAKEPPNSNHQTPIASCHRPLRLVIDHWQFFCHLGLVIRSRARPAASVQPKTNEKNLERKRRSAHTKQHGGHLVGGGQAHPATPAAARTPLEIRGQGLPWSIDQAGNGHFASRARAHGASIWSVISMTGPPRPWRWIRSPRALGRRRLRSHPAPIASATSWLTGGGSPTTRRSAWPATPDRRMGLDPLRPPGGRLKEWVQGSGFRFWNPDASAAAGGRRLSIGLGDTKR